MTKFKVLGIDGSVRETHTTGGSVNKDTSYAIKVKFENEYITGGLTEFGWDKLSGELKYKIRTLFNEIEYELDDESEKGLVVSDSLGRPVFEVEANGEAKFTGGLLEGSSGTLAKLHTRETVLNLIDTKQLLSSIDEMDKTTEDTYNGDSNDDYNKLLDLIQSMVEFRDKTDKKLKAIDEEESKHPKLTKDEVDRIMKAVEKVEEMSKITEIKIDMDKCVWGLPKFNKEELKEMINEFQI